MKEAITRGDNIATPPRATDITTHLLNVDSRCRDSPNSSSASDFYFSLLTPVRNVLRIRITSIEIPNTYFFFTKKRKNVSLLFKWIYNNLDGSANIVIPDGNYTTDQMLLTLNSLMKVIPFKISAEFNEIYGSFTFTGDSSFTIDTSFDSKDRNQDYGLGYYLGFTRGSFSSKLVAESYVVSSDICAYFGGDNYVFLRLNDFGCVRQTVRIYDINGKITTNNEFTALAKIVLREPKNYMAFDDYASLHIKEIVFPCPVDLMRLQVQLLDMYGDVLDICSSQISFSIEVTEVKNSSLYNSIRDSIALQYR